MEKFFIRRCTNGKSFVASAAPAMAGLKDRKCPLTGGPFESQVREVTRANAEVMGINFNEVLSGMGPDGLYFGKFKITLGDTMIIE